MPFYCFECEACGLVSEAEFRVSERPGHTTCACGSEAKRVLSPVTFAIGDSMMEPADFDRKFGKGAAALMASDRDHRRKHDGKAADSGFKGPEWLRP